MKQFNLISVFLVFVLFFSFNLSHASAVDTTKAADTTQQKVEKKTNNNGVEVKDNGTVKETTNNLSPEKITLIISILFFVVMLFLFYKLFLHLKIKDQYLGFQSIKLIGLILMFPGICIIALVGNNLIGGSTLAALLGTIAGYVLSREDDSKNSTLTEANSQLKKDKEALEEKINDLKEKIEQLTAPK